MSSARNAPSSISAIDGMSRTVDASTSCPTLAPSIRSQTGVNRLEYSGKRIVRAESSKSFGGPGLPPDPAADRVGSFPQTQ